MGLGDWWGATGDLLLGAQCPGCDEPGWGLCARCHSAVTGPGYLTRPDPCPSGFPVTATAGPYGPTMKRLVSAHKEHQVLTLTPVLAGRLAVAVEHLLSAGPRLPPAASVVLVPVPSSPAAVRSRGLDATWAMARGAARRCRPSGVVGAERLLTLARRIQDQAGLGAAERRENLRESLRAAGRGLGPGCVALIVDDVVTTGSSLTEARRALRAARIPVLGAATVAATVRSRSGSPRDELRGEAATKTEGRQ